MKLKLKENMYVRTEKGIAKIKKIFPDGSEPYFEAKYETDTYLEIYYDSEYVSEYDVLKASYNIIDILEEGDYVNGYRVCGGSYGLGILAPTIDIYEMNSCNNGLIHFKFYKLEDLDIKSIVIHEQMEQMAYKVVE